MGVGETFRNIITELRKETPKCKRSFYNITAIDNIPSIIENGILSYELMINKEHVSIAMNEIQKRRDQVQVLNGIWLHQYANLYFDYNNPMLYKRKDQADEICVLAVSPDVLDINGCVISDRNASTKLAKFYPAGEGLLRIDYSKIYSQYWNDPDSTDSLNHKAIKCAEVLIPDCVPFSYITDALVVSDDARERLAAKGFTKRIIVDASKFYRK